MTPEEAVEAMRPYAWRLSGSLVGFGDHATREDATQEAMIAVLDAVKRLDPERSPWPFLNVVVRQRIAKYARANFARAEHVVVTDEVPDAPVVSPLDDPETAAIRADVVRRVRDAVAALSPSQRAAVEGIDLQGLSGAEVGRRLGISNSGVLQNRANAFRTLRETLAEVAA